MEEELLKKYEQLKISEKAKREVVEKLKAECKTLKILIEATNEKIAKDFHFWFETVKKKFEWELKGGKSLNMNNNNLNKSGSNLLKNSSNNNKSELEQCTERLNQSKIKFDAEFGK
jgi:DNA invertase Pin-like site-specific DNA recombinase